MINILKLLVGFIISLFISVTARRLHALNQDGMFAALILGTFIMGFGGMAWAILLLGFFISSSLISRFFKQQKANLNEKYAKGSERDAGQVFANGGIAGLFVFLHLAFPAQTWPWVGFAAALAAANADTWSTELGVVSPKLPRLISNGKQVEKGTSGGVTLAGILAALGGAFFIAFLAILTGMTSEKGQAPTILLVITLAGLAGSLIDSLLGATIQCIYYCPTCQKETERHPLHTCGTSTNRLRGWQWLNNDLVNMLCTLSGALIATILLQIIM